MIASSEKNMHAVLIALTALLAGLLLFQFLSHKGSLPHIIVGIATLLVALAMVALVLLLALRNGIPLTPLFFVHLGFGVAFAINLFSTVWHGVRRRPQHSRYAYATGTLFILSLATSFFIR